MPIINPLVCLYYFADSDNYYNAFDVYSYNKNKELIDTFTFDYDTIFYNTKILFFRTLVFLTNRGGVFCAL